MTYRNGGEGGILTIVVGQGKPSLAMTSARKINELQDDVLEPLFS